MNFIEGVAIISGCVAGLGVIITAIVRVSKFITKVNNMVAFMTQLEDEHAIEKLQRSQDYDEAVKRQEKLFDEIYEIKDTLNSLVSSFNEHCKSNDFQRDLMVNQARHTLETVMKTSIKKGFASIQEKQTIGDLFAAYVKNKGNHGVADIFAIYKQLPPGDDDL